MTELLSLEKQRALRDSSIRVLKSFGFTQADMAELAAISERSFYNYIAEDSPNVETTLYLQIAALTCSKLYRMAITDRNSIAANLRRVKP